MCHGCCNGCLCVFLCAEFEIIPLRSGDLAECFENSRLWGSLVPNGKNRNFGKFISRDSLEKLQRAIPSRKQGSDHINHQSFHVQQNTIPPVWVP